MKRGDIWTVAGGPGYAAKPRPVMVLQDNRFDATESITICPFTAVPKHRVPVERAGHMRLRTKDCDPTTPSVAATEPSQQGVCPYLPEYHVGSLPAVPNIRPEHRTNT